MAEVYMHWIKDVFPLIIANLLIFFTLATLKIHGKSTGITQLFATHPPIEARITALRRLNP